MGTNTKSGGYNISLGFRRRNVQNFKKLDQNMICTGNQY